MKRLLVYSHDTYGLGNIRRMLAISEHLCDVHEDLSILIVTGSPMLHAFRISPRIDYVKLPCLSRTDGGDYEVKSLGLDYAATISMRQQILQSAVEQFAPDLILVDKKPFGVDEELRPALDRIRSWPRPPKLVLLLRDILDDPVTTCRIWSKNGYYDAIESYFEAVLVLGSPEVFDLPSEYRFPPASSALVEFCGYIGRPSGTTTRLEIRSDLAIDDDTPLVLVTPGGGEDGAAIIDCHLSAMAGLQEREFVSVVITGPEMPKSTRQHLAASTKNGLNVRVVEFTTDMPGHMAAADLVVCMGGYNTMCEVQSVGRPAVVVPRVRPVEEQLIRARLLAERGQVTMIHPDDLVPDRLVEAIRYELAAGPHRGDELDLDGLERVEKCLAGLIGDA